MNAPTLLIGLGGCGCKIINYVATLVSPEQRKNIEFVAIDTDVNELRSISEENPFVKSIQISSRLTVGEYLEINQHARDTWFPVNRMLNSKVLSEGAGQVRAISRLAFETAVRENKMTPLHEAIDSLFKVELSGNSQALRVIVASSLAGGTGSGIILPVGLYVKNYLTTHFRQSATIIRGFFMLPEVFYGVIPSESGRNNLRSNAYATLRELDAFLMKGDSTLSERYEDSVKIDFPLVDNEGFEDYKVRPYDYCFLYDAQNTEGTKFDPAALDVYRRHAANCIYAQSIGPTNLRSNSSEDNTIRRITADRGRNRYAGAGSSMLVYPVDDIKKYIGLSWTKKQVTDSWLTYDNLYKDRKVKDDRDRDKGITVITPEFEEFFPLEIESHSNGSDNIAKAIYDSCVTKSDDGITETNQSWASYVLSLMNKIESDEKQTKGLILSCMEDAQRKIENIEGADNALFVEGSAWEEFASAYDDLKSYRAVTEKYVDKVARSTAESLFWAPKDDVFASNESYNIISHMKDSTGKFMHPCAIRYFLYKTKQELIDKRKELDADINGADGYNAFMDSFEKNTFKVSDDDGKSDGSGSAAGVTGLSGNKVPLINQVTKKLTEDQQSIKKKFGQYLDHVTKYRTKAIQFKTVETALDYVNSLIDAYMLFFNKLDTRIAGIDRELTAIEKKYPIADGKNIRYVCASRECLMKMRDKYSVSGGGLSISGELSADIFRKVYSFATDKKEKKAGKYFDEVFDKGIVGYYVGLAETQYGSGEIDVNIIQAIENEGRYLCRDDEDDDPSYLHHYIVNTIASARKLSVPYIESPIGIQKEVLYACTYGRDLECDPEDYSDFADIVRKQLVEFGGMADESLGEKGEPGKNNKIVFYQALYGLRANELSKFAPPSNSETNPRSGGVYYKAYFNLIEKLNPDTAKSLALTPHIDRWWHLTSKMPDLDDGNQAMQEEAINAAVFWALLGKFVRFNTDYADKKQYNLVTETLEMDSAQGSLITSNGTKCDQLYELIDAFSIYPELVTRVNDQIRELIEEEVNDSSIEDLLREGFLAKQLNKFRVEQFPLSGENSVRSVFEIPLLIRRSAKGKSFSASENSAIELLHTQLKEIRSYVSCIARDDEAAEETGELVKKQFELFLKNIESEKSAESGKGFYHTIYGSNFFIRICSTITKFVKDMGLTRLSKELEDKWNNLTDGSEK